MIKGIYFLLTNKVTLFKYQRPHVEMRAYTRRWEYVYYSISNLVTPLCFFFGIIFVVSMSYTTHSLSAGISTNFSMPDAYGTIITGLIF
jgi:hypothetical protein